MELAKVTSRGQITLPLAIRRKLDVKEGDKVVFYEENGRIVIENACKTNNRPGKKARRVGTGCLHFDAPPFLRPAARKGQYGQTAQADQ